MPETMELTPKDGNQTLSWIFDQHSDSNGEIPVKKLTEIIERYRGSLSERTIKKLLDYADTNRDGYINKQEIVNLERQDAEEVARGAGVSKSELTMFRRGVRRVARMVLTDEHDQQIYYERYSCLPPPLFMILISIVQISFYIYYAALYSNWWGFPRELIDNPMIFNPRYRHQVWRFITYQFLHAGFEHCFFNVSVQLILGVPLEMVHGGLRVGAIYLAGVLGGSLGSSIFDPYTSLVGASGGVYSLFTAQLANVILNGDVMHKLSSIARVLFVGLILCGDFGYAIYRRFVLNVKDQVSFVAHVAGAIAGLTMGLIVLVNFKKSLRDKVVVWIAVVVYIAFVLFAILWNVFRPID